MHKLEKDFCYFGNEQLQLREHLESLGKEKIVWESLRTVESIVPVFRGNAPALSIELMLNADKTLKEARIVDRVNSITAKYDGSGKLVMDDWLLKHPECMETAKSYEKKLGVFLERKYLIKKPPIPEPHKEVQKPIVTESPKQAFQPHAIKTDILIPASQQEVTKLVRHFDGNVGRPFFTQEQMKIRNAEIDAFCKEKGIEFENHPVLHHLSLKNLRKIVATCEEKHIPFTPYRNFLPYSYTSFSSNIQAFEEHGINTVKFSYALTYPAQNLSDNLKTCKEQGKDPVRDLLIPKLNMNPESFKEFLKNREPVKLRLSAEEKEKKVVEIMAKHGVKEEDITSSVKKAYPAAVEHVIKVCDKHEFNWKAHQYVFSWGANVLDLNLDFCRQEGIDPEQSGIVSTLWLPNDEFKEFLKNHVPGKLFITHQKAEKEVVKIMIGEGLEEEKIPLEIKKQAPVSVGRILETCKMHNFDWKKYPLIFSQGAASLNWKFELCECNDIAVTEIEPINFIKSKDMFRSFIRTLVAEKGAEFREPPAAKPQ